jgi:1-deoxy-D-xylulose-5-phosphate reductoisomerase
MNPRRVAVLGATGSIGRSAIKVARAIPDRMRIVALSAHHNTELLAEVAQEFHPRAVCVGDAERAASLRGAIDPACRITHGEEGLVDLATHPDVDLVLIAIVGTAGLRPALAAIEAGKDIAVASKEILVMAGEIVMTAAARRGVRILPIDSEHNAIFQCLEGRPHAHIARLVLTCSGGPFRTTPAADLSNVTPAMALRHPTWQMGRKITIDSATLFNKGLEMIEARWLFNIGIDRIDVIVHPQSIIHSLVEFADGSHLAQLSRSDMCFPIQYAVTWPDRVPSSLPPLDLAALGSLTFEVPREADFPALRLARCAGTGGGTLPAVLNAANEVAVAAFLDEDIPFHRIWELVDAALTAHSQVPHPDLSELISADQWARNFTRRRVQGDSD